MYTIVFKTYQLPQGNILKIIKPLWKIKKQKWKILKQGRLRGCASFSSCKRLNVNKKSGKSWELHENPNHEQRLLNLPDFKYLDGRPTPYGSRHLRRIEKQKQYTAKILELTSEMDLAMKLYKDREAAKQASIENRINQKLEEKGNKTILD